MHMCIVIASRFIIIFKLYFSRLKVVASKKYPKCCAPNCKSVIVFGVICYDFVSVHIRWGASLIQKALTALFGYPTLMKIKVFVR